MAIISETVQATCQITIEHKY